jgi:Holliday junction resolvasome RuvABC endonuclease subunit
MRILGFDPSLTQFGWALHDTEAQGADRCVARGRFQTSSKTLYVDRYTDLRERVRALIRETQPDHMGIEYPVFKELYSEGMYGLFLFVSEAIRVECQDVVFFTPMQVKAHARLALGRPSDWKMEKPDMVLAAKKDADIRANLNHNEADAYWVSVVAGRFWSFHDGLLKYEDLTPPEQQQFAKVKTYTRGKRAGKTIQSGIMYREDERFFRWSEAVQDTEQTGDVITEEG